MLNLDFKTTVTSNSELREKLNSIGLDTIYKDGIYSFNEEYTIFSWSFLGSLFYSKTIYLNVDKSIATFSGDINYKKVLGNISLIFFSILIFALFFSGDMTSKDIFPIFLICLFIPCFLIGGSFAWELSKVIIKLKYIL